MGGRDEDEDGDEDEDEDEDEDGQRTGRRCVFGWWRQSGARVSSQAAAWRRIWVMR